jgi:glycosyltransferase involved in cell wall biosynthesis
MEDGDLKGLSLAAHSVKHAGTSQIWAPGLRPKLVARGFQAEATPDEFTRFVGEYTEFASWVTTRPFTDNTSEIYQDLLQTSLVLMPSKTEGFGLSGLEAIAAGVPVVVSSESGLAEFLYIAGRDGALDLSLVELCVADVVGDSNATIENWGDKVRKVMVNRAAAFEQARALRSALQPILNWPRAAEEFTKAVLNAMERVAGPELAPAS